MGTFGPWWILTSWITAISTPDRSRHQRRGSPQNSIRQRPPVDINPHIQIRYLRNGAARGKCARHHQNYDIVIDGTDNFQTRYLANDASVLLGKPNVYGSIFRFDGQASVFIRAAAGLAIAVCILNRLRRVWFRPARRRRAGNLPGIIGVIQATEAIKLIIGEGEPLIGRLLLFDALKMKFRGLKLRKNP